MAALKWASAATAEDIGDGRDFLSLRYDDPAVDQVAADWAARPPKTFDAKDLLRAAGLPVLPRDNPGVAKWLKRIDKGEKLSPVLTVEGYRGGLMDLAEGYHRTCAAWWKAEDSPVATIEASHPS